MMRTCLSPALVGAVLALATPLGVAQSPPAQAEQTESTPAKDLRALRFSKLDHDKDGYLVPEEVNGTEKEFATADADQDGKLSQSEFMPYRDAQIVDWPLAMDANWPPK